MVQVFDKNNIDQLNWADFEHGKELESYWKKAVVNGIEYLIKGASQAAGVLAIGNQLLPLVINDGNQTKNQSYVVSNLSQYFDYSREEILKGEKYGKSEKAAAKWLFPIARSAAKFMGFEKVVYVNNWLFSGNLYPEIDTSLLAKAIEKIKLHYPDYAIVFRSIDESGTPNLFEGLKHNGCQSLSARLLYYLDFEETNIKKKRPLQQDIKRWQKQVDFTEKSIEKLDSQTLERVKELYTKLYLDKHSAYNPNYTNEMVDGLFKSGLLNFSGIYLEEELSAIQLIWKRNEVVTTPFIGYDQDLPREQSPYRHMNVVLTQFAQENDCLLNMSSGADAFKKQRGGEPVFEYNMVYYAHLSGFRKLIWKFMIWLGENFIQKQMASSFNEK